MINSTLVQKLQNRAARDNATDLLESYGEYVLWRHRDPTRQKASSKNAHRMAPDETTYEMDDRYRRAVLNTTGDDPTIIGRFVPTSGDLIIALRPSPDTKQAARSARESQYYRVEGANDKRTANGTLAHTVIQVSADRSGRW